jgi:hypothetical protein
VHRLSKAALCSWRDVALEAVRVKAPARVSLHLSATVWSGWCFISEAGKRHAHFLLHCALLDALRLYCLHTRVKPYEPANRAALVLNPSRF